MREIKCALDNTASPKGYMVSPATGKNVADDVDTVRHQLKSTFVVIDVIDPLDMVSARCEFDRLSGL